MSANICFEKGSNQRDCQDSNDVCCDIRDNRQTYRNTKVSKAAEEQHHVKYISGRDDPDRCSQRCVVEAQCCPQRGNSNSSGYSGGNGYSKPSKNNSKPSKSNGNCNGNGGVKPCKKEQHYDDHDYSDQLKHYSAEGGKTLPPHCYELPHVRKMQPCTKKTQWQNAKYCRDDCGSGIIPQRFDFRLSRRIWCRTPLTTYQASHGELGRQILCGEKVIYRNINEGPPCNICEYVLPPCRGYYRQYDCVKPCEEDEENYIYKDGHNRPRDKVERYWQPCEGNQERKDVNTFAPQNMALALKLRKKAHGVTCW